MTGVLITGASSGFGYLTTLALARAGYEVYATMRDLSNSSSLLSEAEQLGCAHHIRLYPLDVTKEADIQQLKQQLSEEKRQVDILINNAGYCQGGPTEAVKMEKWRNQFDTNVLGVIALTKAFLPEMRKRRRGKIIMLSSISGRFGFPALGPYSASKFALEGFSESLRLEMLPFGVHVSLVEPGPFRTKIWEKGMQEASIGEDDDYLPYIHMLMASATHSASKSGNPAKVVHKILEIARSKRPKLRYPIGRSSRMLLLFKWILPWSVIERVVMNKLK
ncbi:SDR family oxidoreductase [Alkalicoccobacillus murimartini]|uniref:NAD(P)-dependent dehydrogenase (Short-subunit alcohol dehydrogenase family) n=1 Tax=Alkalicoccobacillus murimartini TaxID=171685 RepID=A0ABT9YM77_9BACI|nr:SDR family oxidoreductase [Alkalicoccobacillus murimartini]MDQ0208986.1 NAD(P)-dependent dehydrogenase (short-subunit alcohol dehydrogenase family) [Alkalicoccobacillus murimartini]